MISFTNNHGDITALYRQNDGSSLVIGIVKRDQIGEPKDPATGAAWEVRDDKLNSVAKLLVAQAIAIAYAAVRHAAVLRDLLRNHAESLNVKE